MIKKIGSKEPILTIGLQGGQPREVQAASLRSPMNVSSFADTFLLLLRLRHYRVVHSITFCPVETSHPQRRTLL